MECFKTGATILPFRFTIILRWLSSATVQVAVMKFCGALAVLAGGLFRFAYARKFPDPNKQNSDCLGVCGFEDAVDVQC